MFQSTSFDWTAGVGSLSRSAVTSGADWVAEA